jgi:hypothetical protein
MRFCSPEAAADCQRYAAEYKAKAETALLPSERQSFAEIAERFVVMAQACGTLDNFDRELGGQRATRAPGLN